MQDCRCIIVPRNNKQCRPNSDSIVEWRSAVSDKRRPRIRLVFFDFLAELLAEPRIVKSGVALADDLRQLKLLFPFAEKNVLDPGVVARRCGLRQTGLRNLAGIFLRYRIPKGARTSNWAAPRLSAAQITYAATDAWVCRELFLHFQTLGMLAG